MSDAPKAKPAPMISSIAPTAGGGGDDLMRPSRCGAGSSDRKRKDWRPSGGGADDAGPSRRAPPRAPMNRRKSSAEHAITRKPTPGTAELSASSEATSRGSAIATVMVSPSKSIGQMRPDAASAAGMQDHRRSSNESASMSAQGTAPYRAKRDASAATFRDTEVANSDTWRMTASNTSLASRYSTVRDRAVYSSEADSPRTSVKAPKLSGVWSVDTICIEPERAFRTAAATLPDSMT